MSDEEIPKEIQASLGDLHVSVSGDDEEWVAERFEAVWRRRLRESDEMKEALRNGDVSTR